MSNTALILFAHGARDPRWAAPFQRLQALLQQQRPQLQVHLAFLEFMTPSLPEVVAQLLAQQCNEMTLVPVFLGQGGHVLRDLPLLIDELHAHHPQLRLKRVAAIGEDDAVLAAIACYCIAALENAEMNLNTESGS